MNQAFHILRRPVTIALVALTCLAPLAPAGVSAEETDATPTETVVVTDDSTAPALVEPEPVIPADVTPPVLNRPVDQVVNAVNLSGVAVSFVVPTAPDDVSDPLAVACDNVSGTVFPIGTTTVNCWAEDAALNVGATSFTVTVLPDVIPPVLDQPVNLVVDAVDPSGAAVSFTVPAATDAINGALPVACDYVSGTVFPIGTTTVTCSAQDASLNLATAGFSVTVNPFPVQETAPPVQKQEPNEGQTTEPVVPPTSEPATSSGSTVPTDSTVTPQQETVEASAATKASQTTEAEPVTKLDTSVDVTTADSPPLGETEKLDVVPVVPPVPVEPALALPWPPPGNFTIVTDGGPLGRLALIWANRKFPISQEFGHTAFSISQPFMYRYGIAYGLDGFEHTGLDIGMSAGTWLYSPVEGTVKTSGGTPYFTHYGNGDVGVGELLIETDAGDEVVLGHMGAIAVRVGERVKVGQFVGLSGGYNGDHLHLETRKLQPNDGYRIVDPRRSFLVEALASFESLRDELVIDGRLLDDAIIDPSSSYLADGAAAVSMSPLDERQLGDSLLDSQLAENSVVDLGVGMVVETHPDPFLPEDPLLDGSVLPDFVVDRRQALLLDSLASASPLANDRSLDVGSFDEDLLRDSIVNPESAFLLEPRPVSLPMEAGFLREI